MLKSDAKKFGHITNEVANIKAEELVPRIREICNNNKEENIPTSVLGLLHQEGLFRYLQPKKWGGMELGFEAWLDIPEIISRGNCSVGWIVANMASHHRTLAVFSEEVQNEIWSSNPDMLIAAGNIYQQGKAKKVKDGVILSGIWNFCSGIEISDWCFFAFILENEESKDWCQCILHKNDYEVLQDWDT